MMTRKMITMTVTADWSSDGNNEDGDENEEFSLVKPYSNKIDPR